VSLPIEEPARRATEFSDETWIAVAVELALTGLPLTLRLPLPPAS